MIDPKTTETGFRDSGDETKFDASDSGGRTAQSALHELNDGKKTGEFPEPEGN